MHAPYFKFLLNYLNEAKQGDTEIVFAELDTEMIYAHH